MPTTLADARRALQRLDEEHSHYYETLLDPFQRALTEQVIRAIAALTLNLRQTLSLDPKGRIEFTFANSSILGKVDTMFEDLLDQHGTARLIDGFVNQFPGQLPFLAEELNIINSTLKTPLLAGPLLAATDLTVLLAQQKLAKQNIIDVAATVGDLAKRKILLNLNGLAVDAMASMLAKSLSVTPADATTLAATSASMFYRTAYDRVLQRVEASGHPLRYEYDGPRDNLNRPFCARMVEQSRSGRTWSRAEIDGLDNGQLPNVWISAGGYRCRHQWRISLE